MRSVVRPRPPIANPAPAGATSILCGLLVVAASSPAVAADIAVLPLSSSSTLEETVFGVDTTLRAEVAKNTGRSVLSRDETVSQLAGARAVGVECAPTDAACLKNLGQLLAVKTVVVTDLLNMQPQKALVQLSTFDVAQAVFQGRAEGTIRLDVVGRQQDARRLVRRAFGLSELPVETVTTPADSGRDTSTGTDPTETGTADDATEITVMEGPATEQPPEPPNFLPLALLGVGGFAAVAGLVGAVAGGAALGWGELLAPNGREGVPIDSYVQQQQIVTIVGTALLAAGGLGLVAGGGAAVGGGVWYAVDRPE